MLNNIVPIPKIELHCHMDGSISHETLLELSREYGKNYSLSEIKELTTASMDCQSLAEYLAKFDIPLKCIKTKHGLRKIAYDYVKQASLDNIRYSEMRFAPGSCLGAGLTYNDVFESINEGLETGTKEFGTKIGVLVCGMRHLPMEDNIKMLKASLEHMEYGLVVGCDIAGDEKNHTNMEVREFFDLAKKNGMPFTIHSGECQNANNILEAIELGAKRVGHGIAMAGNSKIIKTVASKKIGVEMCPTSNLQTKAVSSIKDYPFMDFYNAGVCINISTDNRTVSGTTLSKEYELLDNAFGLDADLCKKLYTDSVDMIFAPDDVKNSLLKI